MTTVSDDHYADEETGRARAPRLRYTPPQVSGDAAFRKATRHSALVRRLKFILPAIAIMAVVAFWGTMRIVPGDLAALVAVSGIDAKSKSVVMDKPHISGFEGTRRAYEVKADSAVQSLNDPKVMTFKQIVGRFGLDAAGVATVDATTGVYDGNKNTLLLKDGVKIETTDGYSGRFAQAAIDLTNGTLTSNEPLQLSSADGKINANAVSVTERGKRVAFRDGVSVTFMPRDELAAAPGTAEPAPDGAGASD